MDSYDTGWRVDVQWIDVREHRMGTGEFICVTKYERWITSAYETDSGVELSVRSSGCG